MSVGNAEEKMELTERELAIIEGRDPDSVEEEETQDESVEEREEDIATEGDDTDVEGKEAPADSESGAAKKAAPDTSSWIDQSARDYAAQYGIGEDELAGFSGMSELRRTGALIDRSLVHRAKSDTAPPPKEESEEKAEPEIELDPDKLAEDGYDDAVVNVARYAKRLKEESEKLRGELSQLRDPVQRSIERDQEAARRTYWSQFHRAVDELDEDLFGRAYDGDTPKKLDDERDGRRRKVYEAAEMLAMGIVSRAQAAGVEPKMPSFGEMVRRAANMEFGDQLREKEHRSYRSKVAAQSRKRRSVSSGRGAASAPEPRKSDSGDPLQSVIDDPELVEFIEQAERENGSR